MFRLNLNVKDGFFVSLLVSITFCSFCQIFTNEDSISAGLNVKGSQAAAISGYGEGYSELDVGNNLATARPSRTVVFIGHRFSNQITFFSEMEREDAVSCGRKKVEINMEQCFAEFDFVPRMYLKPDPYQLLFYQNWSYLNWA
jgi:hypothetical protein